MRPVLLYQSVIRFARHNTYVGGRAMNILTAKITPTQCRDTALALAFLAMLIWYFTREAAYAYATMGILLLSMLWPKAMTWPARLWFGLAHALGAVMSRLLLCVIYISIVLPVALLRRAIGKDSMRLRAWRGQGTAFVAREHTFVKDDMANPY